MKNMFRLIYIEAIKDRMKGRVCVFMYCCDQGSQGRACFVLFVSMRIKSCMKEHVPSDTSLGDQGSQERACSVLYVFWRSRIAGMGIFGFICIVALKGRMTREHLHRN